MKSLQNWKKVFTFAVASDSKLFELDNIVKRTSFFLAVVLFGLDITRVSFLQFINKRLVELFFSLLPAMSNFLSLIRFVVG